MNIRKRKTKIMKGNKVNEGTKQGTGVKNEGRNKK